MSGLESNATTFPGRWCWALLGLFLSVFAVVSLSGPGRLDILDGAPRYEVARSLVDHGDAVIRDPDVTFFVLPGRDGQQYTTYRWPQSLAGVCAIWSADATGPRSEPRRQFFFTLTSAFACGILAVCYALLFRLLGCPPPAAIGWAAAGIFCTPCWYYGTSVFDDILGTTSVVLALLLAWYGRSSRPLWFAILSGLAIGLAFNCKQPLGLFVIPVLALTVQPGESWGRTLKRMAAVVGGLGVGLLLYASYEWYKFPPGSTADHARILAQYVPPWPGTPGMAVLAFLFSPAAGVFLYCPTLVLSLLGIGRWPHYHRLFVAGLTVACIGFTGFICALLFFKGDLCWGPRYLTPVFAVLWLFVPAAAARRSRRYVGTVLALGLIVELLALSVDHLRLYVELRLPSGFYQGCPEIYFYPRASQLVNRPREMWEILTNGEPAAAYTPAVRSTAPLPCPERFERGPEAVRKYRVLNSFRPWWASMTFLPTEERPVDLMRTATLLMTVALVGLGLMAAALRSAKMRSHSTKEDLRAMDQSPVAAARA